MHYERGYAYPLIVWLHGSAGDERELRRVMPHISMRNHVGVAARGPVTDLQAGEGYCWRQSSQQIEEAEQRVLDCVAAAQRRFHVHPQRVFLAGFGCGGTMAVRIAWNYPGRFAGVASIAGPLPQDHCPLGAINRMRGLPVFLATGQQGVSYPQTHVCNDLRLLHAAGFTVALRQYPCGDDLTTTMLADLDRWVMEYVNCPESAALR